MSARAVNRWIWGLIAAGTAIRIGLAFTTDGQPFDIDSLRDVRTALGDAPLDVYSFLIGPDDAIRWPYPPGFFPFVGLAGFASDLTGLAYTSLVRMPSIAADAAIAWIVQDHLRRHGYGDRVRIAATAIVAFGFSFAVISGYHGQLDSLAILPAVLAVVIWDRAPADRRALYAGLLIGTGACVKTTPILMLLALLPAVRSWREAITLVGAALAVPALVLAPFFLSTPTDVREALQYRGYPGTSGLSILIQPELGDQLTRLVDRSWLVETMYDRGQLIVVGATTLVAILSARRFPNWAPADRAALLWLTFYVVTPVFFFQYLVWGLPFLVLSGRLREAAAIQVAAILPTVLFYRAPWEAEVIGPLYAVSMIALWVLYIVCIVRMVRLPQPTPETA